MSNSVLTAVPAVAGTVATVTNDLPFEWQAAVMVLVGVSLLVAIAAHMVNIWRATRREPPVERQIQDAVDRHERAASERSAEQAKHLDESFEQIGKDFGRVEKRLDGHDEQFRELWRASPYPNRPPG